MADIASEESTSNPQSTDCGARLKYIREYNGLSQRELAKRAGVPHSSISMIEQGLNSPSINSLAKILSGIPMSIAHFFSCDISRLNEQIFRAADLAAKQHWLAADISTQSIPLPYTAGNTRFERVTYAAGADTGEVPNYAGHAVSGLIVSGAIELSLNVEVTLLTAGDAFSLGATQFYRLRNLSCSDACVIAFCHL